jgi:hypothetical protein
LSYDSVILLIPIYPKECRSGYNKGTYTSMFTTALFTVAKVWKQPRCPTTNEWIKKCGIYIQWNFIQLQKRMKFCHSQANGWNWKTSSSVKLARFRRPKAPCFLSYVEYRPNKNTAILWKTDHTRGGHIKEGKVKGRKLRR